MSKRPIEHCRDNLAYAKNLVAVARAVDAQTTSALDVTDILRAAVVAGVSALDHYVHEKVRVGMLAIHAGGTVPPAAFDRFRVSLASTGRALANPADTSWLDGEIREQHGLLTFQQPEKIADALRLITTVAIWEEVAAKIGGSAGDVKRRLKLIVERRNRIAHEADIDPTPPHERWPITYANVDEALAFIEAVAEAVESSA